MGCQCAQRWGRRCGILLLVFHELPHVYMILGLLCFLICLQLLLLHLLSTGHTMVPGSVPQVPDGLVAQTYVDTFVLAHLCIFWIMFPESSWVGEGLFVCLSCVCLSVCTWFFCRRVAYGWEGCSSQLAIWAGWR